MRYARGIIVVERACIGKYGNVENQRRLFSQFYSQLFIDLIHHLAGRAGKRVYPIDIAEFFIRDVMIDIDYKFAASYETMLRSDGLYDLGAVIRYNMDPVVSGQGSAIFIHIWRNGGRKPTAGCVALDQGRLRKLLGWLDANKHPAVWLDPTR